MKSAASLIVTAILLVLAGFVLLAASDTEIRVAAAERALVTLRYERAAEELDEAGGSGLLEPLTRRLSGAATGSAVARYWSGDYDALAQEDPTARLLAANAEYRMLRATGGTPQAFVTRLDAIAKRYADVLREQPDNEDAAYNYEFVLRLRQAAQRTRQAIPGLEPSAGVTVHGVAGAPPPQSDARKFKMIVPMMPDERQEAEEAGRSGRKVRKG